MAFATDFNALIKHLPVKVQSSMEKLPLPKQASMLERFLVRKHIESKGGQINRSADGEGLEAVDREGNVIARVRLQRTLISGCEALLEVEMQTGSEEWQQAIVEMNFDQGQWRLIRIGSWHGLDVENEFMLQEETPSDPLESLVAQTLRTINTALVTYATTYPEVGFPAGLEALSGTPDQDAAQDHARLLDGLFLQSTPIKDGYAFRYTMADQTHYQITATAVDPGNGTKNYFTDETCVIRSTSEPRPTNANDPPLE
jgi:hypothetical protein